MTNGAFFNGFAFEMNVGAHYCIPSFLSFATSFFNQFTPSMVIMPLRRNGPWEVKKKEKTLEGNESLILNRKQGMDL